MINSLYMCITNRYILVQMNFDQIHIDLYTLHRISPFNGHMHASLMHIIEYTSLFYSRQPCHCDVLQCINQSFYFSDQDRRDIENNFRRISKFWSEQDVDSVADMYTETATYMPDGAPTVTGRQGGQSFLVQ